MVKRRKRSYRFKRVSRPDHGMERRKTRKEIDSALTMMRLQKARDAEEERREESARADQRDRVLRRRRIPIPDFKIELGRGQQVIALESHVCPACGAILAKELHLDDTCPECFYQEGFDNPLAYDVPSGRRIAEKVNRAVAALSAVG